MPDTVMQEALKVQQAAQIQPATTGSTFMVETCWSSIAVHRVDDPRLCAGLLVSLQILVGGL